MLRFYIISTVISYIICFISAKALSEILSKEGYRPKKRTVWERMYLFIPYLIPIYNIAFAAIYIFKSEEVLTKTRAKLDMSEDTCKLDNSN